MGTEIASGLDRGLSFGDGLFETMRVVGGAVRYLDLHHARLCHGLRRLHIEVPDLTARMQTAAEACGDGVLKFIVTAGDGAGYSRSEPTEGRIITETRAVPEQPATLCVGPCQTRLAWEPALTGMKHLGRLPQVLAQREVQAARWDEGLMADPNGAWVSGTMNNLFVRVDDGWLTPRLDRGGVAGVMRRVLIDVLRPKLVRLDQETLDRADRMILCNAVRGVQWVSTFDGRELSVNEQGRRLSELLAPWGGGT
jgi:4-amino-4-deoxychorismate lyase